MKKWIAIGVTLALLVGIYIFGSGFQKNTSVFVKDFAVSEDGQEITLQLDVGSSVGALRKVAVYQQWGGKLYLNCYSAFGGINGTWRAQSAYTVSLDADTEIIALFRGRNCYEEVLHKDDNGNWQRAQKDD